MGRKIPLPKRHFGVRDPLLQLAEREAKIKDKINNPPRHVDEQEVSKKFKSFMKLKEATKAGKFKKESKFGVDDDFKATKIDMEGLRKNANESDYKFMKRVNRITHQRRVEAGFAAKYNVNIVRNQETGEIKLEKKPKDEIAELMKKRRAEAKNGKKDFNDEKPEIENTTKLTSLEKLKLKKASRKQQKDEEKSLAFAEYQHEVIKFGEVAQAPPSLVTPRRAEKHETAPRPGKRDLLLTSMLNKSSPIKPNKIVKGPVDRKGKRKNLPNSTRLALENERVNAVDLYRQLKKKQPIVQIQNKNIEDF
ncbi:CLUMA_CG019042, isoform A [Clunio marinus]|uniref:CLUMA_CG019042, isoform A n=1 Tax=Clunio marinus TaxID=568069 RepID=A0A1J1J0L3_9DIPT|nr:CLUMA_CG019042, isoform A [Clunio marinus]